MRRLRSPLALVVVVVPAMAALVASAGGGGSPAAPAAPRGSVRTGFGNAAVTSVDARHVARTGHGSTGRVVDVGVVLHSTRLRAVIFSPGQLRLRLAGRTGSVPPAAIPGVDRLPPGGTLALRLTYAVPHRAAPTALVLDDGGRLRRLPLPVSDRGSDSATGPTGLPPPAPTR